MGQLSRAQWITMFAALLNSALVSLFPPYDYLSLQRGNVPTFAGFYWLFGGHANHVINSNFQALEFFVILINACIAWLLLNNKVESPKKTRRWRNAVLWIVAVNLVVILLFPPFENYASITKAVLPSFEGFYFIFGDNSQRQIVTPILYIEIAFLLINGGLLLLFLKDKGKQKLSPQEIRALAQRLQKQQR
jgi:hypothetical protein